MMLKVVSKWIHGKNSAYKLNPPSERPQEREDTVA